MREFCIQQGRGGPKIKENADVIYGDPPRPAGRGRPCAIVVGAALILEIAGGGLGTAIGISAACFFRSGAGEHRRDPDEERTWRRGGT